MAYTPYEWTVNSYLNPTRMNAIEQGIAAASQAAESASGEFHTIEELIGTQSIAGIGDGTLTGATWKINNDLTELSATVTTLNSNLVNVKGSHTYLVPLARYWQNSLVAFIPLANANKYNITITECFCYEGTQTKDLISSATVGTKYDTGVTISTNTTDYNGYMCRITINVS